MKQLFPTMIDRPEKPMVICGIFYCLIAFWTLPFLLLLFMEGSRDNYAALAWGNMGYHIINFIVAICIFRRYLAESFINVQADFKNILTVSLIAGSVMCLIMFLHIIGYFFLGSELMWMAAFGTLPLTEVELFLLSSDVVRQVPIPGLVCMTVLTPISISCLFYSTAFAPAACDRPWLGYLLVALMVAFPRICNGMTHWVASQQVTLYFLQLPLHLLACWSYQKADTIWAPIICLSITNLFSAILQLLLF